MWLCEPGTRSGGRSTGRGAAVCLYRCLGRGEAHRADAVDAGPSGARVDDGRPLHLVLCELDDVSCESDTGQSCLEETVHSVAHKASREPTRIDPRSNTVCGATVGRHLLRRTNSVRPLGIHD